MTKKISVETPQIQAIQDGLDVSENLKTILSNMMDEKDEEAKSYVISLINALDKKVFKTEVKYMYSIPQMSNETNEEYKARVKKWMPKYAHDGDLGMDLTACDIEYDEEYDRYIYHTGLYIESKREDGCLLFPRSSNSKTSAYLTNSIGLVDSFLYRGEFCLMFKNRTSIQLQIATRALMQWSEMPWYKKLFTGFKEVYDECEQDIRENILDLAPYSVGDRIAQMVWLKFPEVTLKKTKKFTKTARGEGGFGSTGK